MLLNIVYIVILIACSGFFSGSETSLFSLSQLTISRFRNADDKRSNLIADLLVKPQYLLITLLIGNMIVNILASSVSVSLFRSLLDRHAEAVSVFTMTMLIIIFGEIMPKTIAIQNAEKLSRLISPTIRLFSMLFAPLRNVIWYVSIWMVHPFIKKPGKRTGLTEGELKTAVKLGLTDGVLDQHERDMIHGVLDVDTKQVREIMKPRMEMFALPVGTEICAACDKIRQMGFNRVPLYEHDLDNVVGILYTKDLLYKLAGSIDKLELKDIMRPPFFAPETMRIDRLMQEFRKQKKHLALVVDEYGSITGLITLEDLLEMIVGDIDAKRFETRQYHLLGHDSIKIDSRLSLDKFNEVFGCSLADEYAVTVGGYLLHKIGRIPQESETFQYAGLQFAITRALKNRIDELVITRRTPKDTDTEAEKP